MATQTDSGASTTGGRPEAITGTVAGGAGKLFYRFQPVDDAVAVAVIVHGLAEHSGRYQHVMAALADARVASLALDLRGHGRSDGTRVFVERFGDYADDANRALQKARELAPGLPVFLIGHSMGGLTAVITALDHGDGLTGLVLSSPGLKNAIKVPAWKDALGKLMARLIPKLAIPTGLPAAWVSRDPAVVAAYEADPLVTNKATARWYAEFLGAQERARAEAGRITMPTLILTAGKDKLIDPGAQRELFETLGSRDKEHIPYPELYHEVFNEPEQAAVLADLVRWLTAHVG
ncbi:MAG: lysophospholipase [Myxococcales bacterium]|nr:lysophospholipase [Myxococcales bacterium]MCB9733018.1 lysophospholipase [Deltaproteobacteria bacterium]